MTAAVGASIFSAVFINPIRMIEKQQRAAFRTTGVEKVRRRRSEAKAGAKRQQH